MSGSKRLDPGWRAKATPLALHQLPVTTQLGWSTVLEKGSESWAMGMQFESPIIMQFASDPDDQVSNLQRRPL